MNDILHGTWVPAKQFFFLWGEATESNTARGRRKLKPHPFQLPLDTLYGLLERLLLADLVAAIDTGSYEYPQTFWLPATAKLPIPSPELSATGTVTAPTEAPELLPWQVVGLALPITIAVDLLPALTEPRHLGADLRAWRTATLLALELLAGQQVLPTLMRDGFQLRAVWRPQPIADTAQKIGTLARSMPPLCRAAVDEPAAAPSARALLGDFLTAAVDSTVRELALTSTLPATTPGGKWLQALLGKDSLVPLKGPAADALYKSWQDWSGQGQVAGDDVFRITFRLEPPAEAEQPWELTYLLQATDEPSLLVPVKDIWRERGAAFTYLDRRFEHPQERLLTGLGFAARLFPPLQNSLRQAAPDRATLDTTEAFTFLKEATPLLEQSGFGVLVPAWLQGKGARLQAKAQVKTPPNEKGVLSFEKMISFSWELALGDQPLDLAEFERLVALKMPLVQVRGQWVVLDPEHMQQALRFFKQRGGSMSLIEALRLGLGGDGQVLPPGVEVAGVEAEGWLGEALRGLSNPQQLDLLPPPDGLQATLRPYQVRGYSWLAFLQRFGLGACLADDMGLGKTVQTISLLLHDREQEAQPAPTLLVCPTSVIGNWQREVQRFAPALRVLVHQGTGRPQGDPFVQAAQEHDLVLTSFPLLARDRDTLTGVEWGAVVLDEAQNIKNAGTKQAQAARALTAPTRIALTGTPVENRLTELWSIMAFLNPGYLGNETAFRRDFARPIERTGDENATARLRRLTAPFILRRLKTDKTIIADLPDKIEKKEYCRLTPEQATLYESVVRDALQQIENADTEENAIQRKGLVLAMLMKLKQVCNHPAQFLKDGSAFADRSGKLARLSELLEEIYAAGDRVLIFTQFAELGEMLRLHLSERLYEDVLFLHGGTKARERDGLVRRFQAPGGPTVFILSIKAGGTGLNLTAANHVVHFDRWWNPAVENQATDRAFRIGQQRNVEVHKFVCTGTLEERIDEMIESKRTLAEQVLGSDESWLTSLSTNQLRDLVALRQDAIASEEE
ncbi:MAG: DEAD/DEAH box helicase [Chloroflexaceae bacterium]